MFVLAGAAGIGEFMLAAIDVMRHVGRLGMWELFSVLQMSPVGAFMALWVLGGWTGPQLVCQL